MIAMTLTLQDVATTAVALVGVTLIVRRLVGAMRPRTAAKCEHCPTGAAVAKAAKSSASK